jgi:hypothetical protein
MIPTNAATIPITPPTFEVCMLAALPVVVEFGAAAVELDTVVSFEVVVVKEARGEVVGAVVIMLSLSLVAVLVPVNIVFFAVDVDAAILPLGPQPGK